MTQYHMMFPIIWMTWSWSFIFLVKNIKDHDKMILPRTHLLLTHPVRPFLIKSAREAFLPSVSFYQQKFLATFYLILLHLSMQILTLEIYSFKPLRYTCEYHNCYKLWKSTKLGIFLIFKSLNLRAHGHFITKKAPAWIFLRQIKHITHDDFSVCSLNIKSFYHGQNGNNRWL